jgi:5-methylcytosine-specific restriction endonuclease McrA
MKPRSAFHGRAQAWDLDHVIPLSKGGEHSYDNVQVTHPSCNRKKGAKVAA